MSRNVRIGIIGGGRIGKVHATNLSTRVAGVEVAVMADPFADEKLETFAADLGITRVTKDYKEILLDVDIDAVLICSPTDTHADISQEAALAGKHVFCDKPLDTTVEKCRLAEKAVEAHPDKVFMLGFMRRYDYSYRLAKQKIDNGDIGKVILVRCYSQDPRSTIEGTLKFAPHSGGQFLDMCVHDIDLVRWFTGSEPKNVWSIGGVYEFDLYRELNDGDNVSCMMQCENDAMAFMFAGRAAAQGSNVETEIVGTLGTLRIGSVASDSLLEVMNEHGVCRELYPDFPERWHEAYTYELTEFVKCIREDRMPEVTVYDGTAASKIAYRCKESFETGAMLAIKE